MSEPERGRFYRRTLERLLELKVIEPTMSVLVVAGGPLDRDVFASLGFEDVTLSGLDEDGAAWATPFRYARHDAEALDVADESVDVAVASAALHHCRSPHGALLELYRVARRAVVALEARDSFLIRLATRIGAIEEYELESVAAHRFRGGGVRDTAIPNYVFRWTEREVEKTIASHAPWARHRILYFHELELPHSIVGMRNRRARGAWRAVEPALRLVARVAPRQANLFAFAIAKPELPRDAQPWIRVGDNGPVPDEQWIGRRIGA